MSKDGKTLSYFDFLTNTIATGVCSGGWGYDSENDGDHVCNPNNIHEDSTLAPIPSYLTNPYSYEKDANKLWAKVY